MAEPAILKSLRRKLSAAEADALRRGQAISPDVVAAIEPVERSGEVVGLDLFDELMAEFNSRFTLVARPSRPETDAWLAPRLHWTLRLSRREAGDPGLWRFLGNAHRSGIAYTMWRWGQDDGTVADNRFEGAINKQALARLWWGAELFRNGSDYSPVEQFFTNQDFPNSILHRPFARNRPLALATVDALQGDDPGATSDQINDVARNVNLWIAALSIDAATVHHVSDPGAYGAWVEEQVDHLPDADSLPTGPSDGDLDESALEPAREIVTRICELAGVTSA